MQNIKIIRTDTGDFTLYHPDIDEHYHSTKGAIAESQHVYIENGLKKISKSSISILEIGFGTGLNAFLSAIYATENNIKLNYLGLEKFPVNEEFTQQLNYARNLKQYDHLWQKIVKNQWNKPEKINDNFILYKLETDLLSFETPQKFNLIYYDAFAPDKQPEMWTEKIIQKIATFLSKGGLITTYTAKGTVKQAFRNQGLEVKRVKGALGKHHMLNIWKNRE